MPTETTQGEYYIVRVKGCPMPYRHTDRGAAFAQFHQHTWPARLIAVHTDGSSSILASTM